MTQRIVFGTVLFIFISRSMVPSYSDIMYYWMINVLQFSKKTIALLALTSFFTAIAGTFLYKTFLKNFEYRCLMFTAQLIIALSVLVTLMLVTRFSKEVLGINDIFFAFFTDATIEVMYSAFVYMPTLVIQTRIVPKNVEATVYSVISSLRNIANAFVSPLVGGKIAYIIILLSI